MKHWHLLRTAAFLCFAALQTQAQIIDTSAVGTTAEVGVGLKLEPYNSYFEGSVLAPFQYGGKVFFTATTPNKQGDGKVSRLFTAIRNERPQPMPINPKEDDIHAAHATLNASATRIYYTLFKEDTPGKPGHSEICYRDRQYDGTWGSFVKLPKHINKPGAVNAQPACGYDLNLKKDLLFFASNRSGGQGGFDIWYCTVERDGTFGEPVNLPCNSPSDEMTPHFISQEQMLFFSSSMLGGQGGFDIYFSEKNAAGQWLPPNNFAQANTAFDELYYSYNHQSNVSYLCSNRPNATCGNLPDGCSDFSVFSGKLGAYLIVDIRNTLDSAAIYGCNIEIEDAQTKLIEQYVPQSEDSTLHFTILPEKKYRLIVSRRGFYPVFVEVDANNVDYFQPIKKQVFLRPMR